MNVDEAVRKWKYKAKLKQRLEEVCRSAPDRFVKDGQICIPEEASPIYIPDRRYKSDVVYPQLLKAVQTRREVIPESLHYSAEEIADCLILLASNGLIQAVDTSKPTTLCYILTPEGESYFVKGGVKRLVETLRPLVPPLHIHFNI